MLLHEKPWAYWPFLIIKAIYLFFAGIFTTIFIFLAIIFVGAAIITNGNIADTVKEYGKNYRFTQQLDNTSAMIMIILLAIFVVFYMWFQMWQWVIVYKARKYMVHEVKTGKAYEVPIVQEQRDLIKKV
uniref:Uncharacterized protein n=1 Tax=Panagrolaimus sp. JU765 TaxID=591449 RepID=A0AC34PWU4_9BILA